MKEGNIKNVTGMSSEDRYDYLVSKVAGFEQIWCLRDDEGWALMGNEDATLFPVWPEEKFAKLCATDEWINYTSIMVNLYDFMEKLSPKLQEDNVYIVVFPTPEDTGLIQNPVDFTYALEEECELYG